MTDDRSVRDAVAEWRQLIAQGDARARLADEALPANKTALFDALAAVGITIVSVTFDGYGDSGQIESVDVRAGEVTATLPDVDVEIATPAWDGAEQHRRTLPLSEAIEQLAYAFLAETHGGWENNGGAYGEFMFDVGDRTIHLDYHERVESSDYSGHEW